MKQNRAVLAVCALALASGACAKKPQAAPPAPEVAPQVEARNEDAEAARRAAAERARREAEERARREAERARAVLAATVFFDYDSYNIREDSKSTLDAKVAVLRADPSLRLTIAGHADDRGSTEYNIALGMRRAAAVRDYLAAFGIDAGRFQTVSFGEERPADPSQSETAWSRNRRAEFEVNQRMAGGQ